MPLGGLKTSFLYNFFPSNKFSRKTLKRIAMKRKKQLLLLLFLFLLFKGIAQKNRFHIGLLAGLNFAELEGDGITDYFGLNAGLLGEVK